MKPPRHLIQLLDVINKKQLGYFEYVHLPRVGEWVLTPDNDGSNSGIWVVENVVHFAYREFDKSHICLHVSPSTREVEESITLKNIFKRYEE